MTSTSTYGDTLRLAPRPRRLRQRQRPSPLLGCNTYQVDHKGRLVVPAWARSVFGASCAVYALHDRLWLSATRPVLPLSAWVEIDRTTGRIQVPEPLRRFAGIRKGQEVVMVGHGDRVQIAASWREALECVRTTPAEGPSR